VPASRFCREAWQRAPGSLARPRYGIPLIEAVFGPGIRAGRNGTRLVRSSERTFAI
jgi:hypothetical protein